MTKSPDRARPRYTKEQMLELFNRHGFRELLKKCEEIRIHDEEWTGTSSAHPETTFIRGRKYRLNRVTVAVIFYYTLSDDTVVESIRMLLIDGVKHEAVQLSGK